MRQIIEKIRQFISSRSRLVIVAFFIVALVIVTIVWLATQKQTDQQESSQFIDMTLPEAEKNRASEEVSALGKITQKSDTNVTLILKDGRSIQLNVNSGTVFAIGKNGTDGSFDELQTQRDVLVSYNKTTKSLLYVSYSGGVAR